jgi:hypothetical protein
LKREVIDRTALRRWIRGSYRTGREFAEVVGINQPYLSAQLSGNKPVGFKLVAKLIELGLTDSDIFLPAKVANRTGKKNKPKGRK